MSSNRCLLSTTDSAAIQILHGVHLRSHTLTKITSLTRLISKQHSFKHVMLEIHKLCVCVCVCEGEREGGGDSTNAVYVLYM